MPKIEYVPRNFSAGVQKTLDQANTIIENYQVQGLTLTLRQLYYRFVATGLLPNSDSSYSRLGTVINNGRLAGLIDWEAIEDRGRNLNRISSWDDPGDIIRVCADTYAIDLWEGQEHRVEVWVEKQALEAVVEDAASALAVPSFACKGYTSSSEMWRAAERLLAHIRRGQTPVIIHLGDHDPSGIDMTRDIRDRLAVFGARVEVRRIALNMDQVNKYSPPPNPAKLTDSRARDYIAKFGDESWELDALEPADMRALIQDNIRRYIDEAMFDDRRVQQEQERELLTRASDRWYDVSEFLGGFDVD